MPLLSAEACFHEGCRDLPSHLYSDDASAKTQNIHVVVLDALVGRIGVVAHTGAHTTHLVGRHAGPHSTPTYDYSAISTVTGDTLAYY